MTASDDRWLDYVLMRLHLGVGTAVQLPAELQDPGATVCLQCGEGEQLAKVKGCVRCLRCGYKFDCNGW